MSACIVLLLAPRLYAGHETPQVVRTGLGDAAAELRLPIGLRSVLVAPRPKPPCALVQRMLVGEAHRRVDLMDDTGGEAGRLADARLGHRDLRSEEHTSELQSLMRISYAVFCLKKKKQNKHEIHNCTQNSTNYSPYNRQSSNS